MATKLSEAKMFGGTWLRLKHDSKTVGTPMEFSVCWNVEVMSFPNCHDKPHGVWSTVTEGDATND